ncbi:unnamed protein product [Rotaria socialis]|uniref:Uncharacterized protein n=1 Tax=Rotaria socialis TaxID=392032 RepID=A0A821FBM3_9BILA|nr:unnamed protein product [Rotaria socialis]CAF4649008.1 unnamed protein product [Rotaria socialis]
MSSASLFEQLISTVSSSRLANISITILAPLLIFTVVFRVFFSSSKPKGSPSNQNLNKNKKAKESNTIKKQQGDATSNNKKNNNKIKTNSLPVSPLPSVQTEESENEKAALILSMKKSALSVKASAGKKSVVVDENNKTNSSINGVKPSLAKQQPPVHGQNVEGQNGDNKSKQSKSISTTTSTNATITSNKQKTSGKHDITKNVNTTNANKNESAPVNSESKRTLVVDADNDNNQEDDGQWLTQGIKQVNHRSRNKGKTEISHSANQQSSNKNVVIEQRLPVKLLQSNISLPINSDELNIEAIIPSNNSISSIENREPIEIYQLLPKNENLYVSTDNWWKQALNKQQTFSIDDIGEWPERELDEQYIVQIKKIIPGKELNENQNSDEI